MNDDPSRQGATSLDDYNGAISRHLMAIFGWDTLKAERYTRSADQQRLAESAMYLLETK